MKKYLKNLSVMMFGAFVLSIVSVNVQAEEESSKPDTYVKLYQEAKATDDANKKTDSTSDNAADLADNAENQMQDIAALTGSTGLVVKALAQQNSLSAQELKLQAEGIMAIVK